VLEYHLELQGADARLCCDVPYLDCLVVRGGHNLRTIKRVPVDARDRRLQKNAHSSQSAPRCEQFILGRIHREIKSLNHLVSSYDVPQAAGGDVDDVYGQVGAIGKVLENHPRVATEGGGGGG